MKKKIFIIVLIFFINAFIVNANSMKLLAVSQDVNGTYQGSVADLEIEIREGNGKVFIDTYPYSKIDTQISSRFAKEIACDFLDTDCNKLDFFYTITAGSYIIGGPSGSSAIAALTIITLDNLNYDRNVAITGSINSGGFIGSVSGIKEKIEAAAKQKITKVLIPIGTKNQTQQNNISIDLIKYGADLGIKVVEVADINEVIFEFTDKKYPELTNIKVEESYKNTMKTLAQDLCGKSKILRKKILDTDIKKIRETKINLTIAEEANNMTNKGLGEIEKNNFYSAASFCFGANVKFSEIIFELNNESDLNKLKTEIEEFESSIDLRGYKTITDLQAYMVVKERLKEAKEIVNLAYKNQKENKTFIKEFAYANERLHSAKSWSKFLNNKGKEFHFDPDVLRASCSDKIAEAEERWQYLNLFLPNSDHVRKDLDKAKVDQSVENYELCLFRASKSKAQINSILNFIGVKDVKQLIDNKFSVIEKNIAKKIDKNIFPIVGYSYFEYAKSLSEEEDYYSSILYGEYALELSDIEIYFKPKKDQRKIEIPENSLYLTIGLIIGFFIGLFIKKRKK